MENPKDLLRELPRVLIFDIFWRLPMTGVVRTSVLSKRWRNFWTTSSFLNFDNRAMLFSDDKLRKFVDRALLHWNGDRILRFRFHSGHELASSMFNDVDLWVNFAQRNGVEQLYLHVLCSSTTARHDLDGKEVYRVPPCLYSCSSLKVLGLQHCNLENGNVQWNKLEELKINVFRTAPDVITQILSSTSQLKVFDFTYVDKGGNLSIQSTSLKELFIFKFSFPFEDVSLVSELRICTPNLESLEIVGDPYKKHLLTDVSSLTHAVLGLPLGLGHILQDGLLNALSQVFLSIQHAENVELLDCCTEVLGAMKMKCVHSAFRNVKHLDLACCFNGCKRVVGILEIFPQLESLYITNERENGPQDDTEFEANLPESFLLQLRTIEVTYTHSEYYAIFPLIEILLKYASKLEKIVFEVKEPAPSDALFLVSQKLLRMRRSSSNCTIELMRTN